MELLIAGGIALLGYNMSAPVRTPRPATKHAKRLGPSNEYITPGNSTKGLTKDYIDRAEKRWQAARDPAVSGIVTPHTKLTNAQLPFFTSAKKQNTNEGVKQTLLETFTGTTSLENSVTGTYRHKQEVEAMFSPQLSAMPLTSSGTGGNPMNVRENSRFENSPYQNNVLPAPKVWVGRGVGVGPEVAATDGFHPMHRVMLKNVNEYRKNNLPGSVNHGASAVSNRTSDIKMDVNKNPGSLVYDQNRRPMQASRAAVLGARIYPQEPHDTVTKPKLIEMDRFGNPTKPGHEIRDFQETRIGYSCGTDHHDRNKMLPQLNVTGAASGVGGFTHADFDNWKLHTQQREAMGREGFVSGPVARKVAPGQILPPTQREMTSDMMGFIGGVGVIRSSGTTRKMDDPKVTLRETQEDHGVLTGTRAAVQGGTLDNVWRYKRLDRQAKRQNQLIAHSNGPARINVPGGNDAIGSMALMPDNVQVASPFMPSVPNKQYAESLGRRTTPHNKLPHANPRLDLCTAANQLRDNPFAQQPLCQIK